VQDGKGGDTKQREYVEALKKGGIDQKTAKQVSAVLFVLVSTGLCPSPLATRHRCVLTTTTITQQVLDKWKEAGAEGDPNQLRKLFLKQSLAPITASAVQVWCSTENQRRVFAHSLSLTHHHLGGGGLHSNTKCVLCPTSALQSTAAAV
jgi:hypothetical protein